MWVTRTGWLQKDAAELDGARPSWRGSGREAASAVQQLLHSSDELAHRGCIRVAILVERFRGLAHRNQLARNRRGDLVLMHHRPGVIRRPLSL